MSQTIHETFRQVARSRQDAVALVDGAATISFVELDELSDAIMSELLREGHGPGSVVPLFFPRSIGLVGAILGALKAGSAYLCLDPRWPAERVVEILGLVGASRVFSPAVPQQDVPFAVLDTGLLKGPEAPQRFGKFDVGPLDPATIFLTSGSTGAPKAVVSPHVGTTGLLCPCHFAHFSSSTRMPLAAALPWDAHSLELWGPLLNGGTCLIHRGPYLDAASLRRLLSEGGANMVWLSSSIFNLIIEDDIDSMEGLSTVLIGGEKVSPPHVRRFLERYPHVSLINGYGPVEATVFASTHRISLSDCSGSSDIPIGHAIADTDVAIVEDERTCGANESGEICIATRRLALGYLHDPDLTAKRFVQLSLDGEARRYYRTGDRGRKEASGLLHWEGRLDRQVKMRGHRIDPGEVESLVLKVPGVARCVMVPLRSQSGSIENLAVCYTGRRISSHVFRETMRRLAPSYLIPSHFWHLERLPLLDSGKLDHQHLQAFARERSAEEARAPRTRASEDTAVELVRCAVESLLGPLSIGDDDSLYEAGASSLDLGRLCARLRRDTGHEIRLSEIFDAPTISAIARHVERLQRHVKPAAQLVTPSSTRCIQLGGMSAALVMRQCFDPRDTAATCPVAWWVDGSVDVQALRRALTDVVERHEALRSSYRLQGGNAVAIVGDVCPTLREVKVRNEEDALEFARQQLTNSLDIASGEVIRAVLVATNERALLFIAIHHVAFDGRSEHILADELSVAYNARRQKNTPNFEKRAVPLHEVSEWLTRASSDVDTERKQFWTRYLHGVPNLNCLAHGNASTDAGKIAWNIPARNFEVLRSESRRRRSSLFALLLSHYVRALASLVGQHDFGVGVPVNRRTDERVQDTLACLIDVICVRSGSVLELAAENRPPRLGPTLPTLQTVLAHQEVPFSEVVRLIRPERGPFSPLFQTMFVLQQADPSLSLDGCETRFERFFPNHSMTELGATIWPHSEGNATLEVIYQSERVSEAFARSLGATLMGQLTSRDTSSTGFRAQPSREEVRGTLEP